MNKERKLLEKKEVINLLKRKIEDCQYSLKKARSPQSKRGYAWAVNFYKSLKYWVEKSNNFYKSIKYLAEESKENENNQ